MPASFLASATIATRRPRLSSTWLAQSTIGSRGRHLRALQLAWTNAQRSFAAPALVIPVRCCRSELEVAANGHDGPRLVVVDGECDGGLHRRILRAHKT